MFEQLQLQPAAPQDLAMYLPYYKDGTKRNLLPFAMSLYKRGNLEGQRIIEGSESVPFVATWNVSSLPSELTRCRLQFENDADLNYEISLTNNELIEFLIELLFNLRQKKPLDFSQGFYRQLLRMDS
jgi:hypothetical protein